MKPMLLLATIGVALVGFIGYHGVYVPQQEQVRLIQGQIDQERANQHAQQTVAALLEQLRQYRTHLPPEPDPSWLVRQVVSLGQESGIQVTSILQEPPKPFESFTLLAVTLQFTASYHTLGRFLDQLEHAPPFIRVDRLELADVNPTTGDATIHLTVSTLYVPPLVQAAPASDTLRGR